MAKIPKIQPTGNQLTSQAPNQFMRAVPGRGAAAAGFGNQLQRIGQKVQAAGLLAEKTKADNELSSKLNEIKSMAGQDNDLSEERRSYYDGEIEVAVSKAAENISVPYHRSLFEQQAKGKADISRNYVQGTFMRKIVDNGKAELDIYLQNKRDEFIQAPSPQEKELAISERNEKIREMTEAGFLSPAAAMTLKDEQNREWGKAQVQYDISSNPAVAVEMLKAGDYPDISEEDRVDLLNQAKSAVTKREKDAQTQLKIDYIQNEAKMIQAVAGGELTMNNISDISAAVARQEIRPEVGKAAIRAVLKPIDDFDMKENDEAFVKMTEGVFSAENPEDMNAVLKDILQGFNKNDLSQRNMTLLMQTANKIGAPAAEVNRRVELFRSNYHKVAEFADKNGIDKAALIKSYTEGINRELTPDEAAEVALEDGLRMADPGYKPERDKKEGQPVQVIKEGQTVLNIKTGEKMQMVGGRWIQIQ